ncbi:tetratricopeptide repeat-containing sensor histidine kinase [Marivirga salinae]|uniref:histidine kinase n=1 Tax=Marivirga salinarum TaxID=3059078 RepID=A0AA51RE29_9BACT|nr:tetratricopeptide repeat-containing sensor histidine kinase [Marivirga sp. BDSF4-3]WMN11639.1 tetratricopeptide repeat-containing sensor histidine kinase [Marivirga sp. BDSF4-3]
MRRLILYYTIALFCCHSIGFSENSNTDSLQSLLPHLKTKDKVEVLHSLILDLWFEYPDSAKQYAKQAINISTELEDIRLQSISLRLMGGVHTYQGEYELSLINTRKALNLALQIKDSLLITTNLNNLGYNYYNLGNYSEATENLLRALNIYSRIKEKYGLGYTLNNIGQVYLKLKNFSKASKYFNQAMELGKNTKNKHTILYTSNNLGFLNLEQDKYQEAESFFKKSIEIAEKVSNKNWEATAYSGLAQTYYHLGDIDKAINEFKKSLILRVKIKELKGISEIYYYLSKMSASSGKIDSAMYYLNISQNIAKDAGIQDQLLDNFKLYKALFTQQDLLDSALIYQSRYIELREKQFDENSARSIEGIQLEIKEEETARKLASKDIQLAKKSFQLNFFIAVAIFILLIAIVVFWFYKTQKKLGKALKIKNFKISKQRDEIIQKNQELSTLNIEKNDLINIVSHDLKSPLNNIRGIIGLIKLPPLPPENRAAEFLKMINESTIRLSNMIEKILDVEAIESKKLNIKLEKINFSDVVHSTINRFDAEAMRKQIQLHPSIIEDVMIKADESYLIQVLENLLSNAIKFSPKGKNIYINVTNHKNKALCEVKDEGPGLSDNDKKKLFRKYQKLSNVPTANESSTGLGLSIVKKFVNSMDGEIWCESEHGKGASFFVGFKIWGKVTVPNRLKFHKKKADLLEY